MISGVKVKELRLLTDERGSVMELLRSDDAIFRRYGQTYMTTVSPGYAKAWHLHKKQTDNIACVRGSVRFVMYDERADSPTKGRFAEILLGPDNCLLIQVPPQVWHGFESINSEEAILINSPDLPYCRDSPDEFRRPFDSLAYKWQSKKGG
ncbi:MAG: dTDP-4-dehydrorhamnose 3,5-epimerase family protein [archaeon]